MEHEAVNIKLALEMVFDAYKIRESSIAVRPLIIQHIVKMWEADRDAAFQRGVEAAQNRTAEHLSHSKAGREILEEMLDDRDL